MADEGRGTAALDRSLGIWSVTASGVGIVVADTDHTDVGDAGLVQAVHEGRGEGGETACGGG